MQDMNKRIILFAASLLALAACSRKQTFESTFETAAVERGDIINSVTSTGTVEPVNSVDVGTQVSGIIEKIYVDYNSTVKAGQLIAELDRTTLEAEEKSSMASLASARAELVYQEANYRRTKSLYDSTVVSDSDMESAQYQYDKAKAAVMQAEANYSRVKKNLSYSYIYSPIDGVVLYRAVEEGQTVASSFSTPTLFTIAQDLKKMEVIADVDEADIGQVQEGQDVTFTVDAYPDDTFSGVVSQVRLQATTTSNVVTYEVVIDAPNEDLKLKPGLTANITIITSAARDVLLVPVKALTFKPDLPEPPAPDSADADRMPARIPDGADKVYVKDTHGLHPIQVKTGLTNGIKTEITEGLSVNDTVIIAQTAAVEAPAPGGQDAKQSPFMPKRPGENKKK